MNCIKCGKKLKNHHVFCEDCLALAENYPIDPDTPVILPKITEDTSPKKRQTRKRPASSPEEQLPRLRKTLRRMVLLIVFLCILLTASLWVIWKLLQRDDKLKAKLPTLYSWQVDADQNVSRETTLDSVF